NGRSDPRTGDCRNESGTRRGSSVSNTWPGARKRERRVARCHRIGVVSRRRNTMIELTPEQRQAVRQQHGEPLRLVDPDTHEAYVLIPALAFEQITEGVSGQPGQPPADIPPGLMRSQQAFWRDLPELLKDRRTRGKWVAYHGDEQVGVAADD